MTASQLLHLITEADRLLKSPSHVVHQQGLAAFHRARRWLASGEPFEIEMTCAHCTRPGRAWFATGVADDYLHPLCSRACIAEWKTSHQGARVLKRDGRDYVEQPATARRAA